MQAVRTGDAKATTIVLFDRDLRLADHAALHAARNDKLVALWLATDDKLGSFGGARRWWLHHSLVALDESLSEHGGRLTVIGGRAADAALAAFVRASGAKTVHFSARFGTTDGSDDVALASAIRTAGAEPVIHSGQLLHDPASVRTGSGGHFRVYTPFWKAVSPSLGGLRPLPAPERLEFADVPESDGSSWRAVEIASLGLLPTKPDWAKGFSADWLPGERGAHEKLEGFIDGALDGYGEGRNRPDLESTSRLSPHLAFGEISPVSVLSRIERLQSAGGARDREVFVKEMVWREFSYHLLHHNPDLATRNFNPAFDDMMWDADSPLADAWRRGETGFPIVDAGMRQLWMTGWMHNRVRMIVASFLTKHLLTDWRIGERWFADTLVDFDHANNAASWQWVAGTGADAAPYFRVFNPILQGKKFDPDGAYVRKFVPELARLPNALIHEPWSAPALVLREAGIRLGQTYPKPIIDHANGRERALSAWQALREAS